MARLEHLGGDRWKLYVDVGPPGQRTRRTRVFTAKGDAKSRAVKAKARDLEAELAQQRLHLAPERITMAQAAEAWWAWWSLSDHSPTTGHEYRRLLDRRIIPGIGSTRVERLSAGQLSRWYADLSAGLAPGSVRALHVIVRQVLDHATLHQWCTRNVAESARLPAGRARAMQLPTLEQIAALVAAAGSQTPMARRALIASFGLGVRRGELAGLRASRISWDAAEVLVDTSITDKRSGAVVKGTKTHQARRVPLRPWVADVLQEQLAEHQAVAARRRVPMAADPWVWSQAPGAGEQPKVGWFTLMFTRARESAGLQGVRLHDLRHGFASWLLAEGVPITEVAGLLGHGSPAVTARIYSHADPTLQGRRAAMERLPALPSLPPTIELPEAD